jgi:hypothetical protein
LDAAASFPAPPRAVRRKTGTAAGIGCLRVFMLPHLLVGLFLLFAVPARLYVYHFGAPVTAIVDRVESRTSRKHGDYYLVQYHYLLDGRRFDDSKSPSARTGRPPPRVGDTFAGRAAALLGHALFLPASLNIVGDITPLAIAAVIWNGFIGVWLYIAWILPLCQRWLATTGEAAIGTITHWQANRRNRTTQSYTVSYSFTTPDGRSHDARCRVSGRDRPAEGATITVLYAPRRPRWNLPYECSDFVVMEAAMR